MLQNPTDFKSKNWTPAKRESTPSIQFETAGDGTRITNPGSRTPNPYADWGDGLIAAASESLAAELHCWSIRIDNNQSNAIVCGVCLQNQKTNVKSARYFSEHHVRNQPFAIVSNEGFFLPYKYSEEDMKETQQLPTGSIVTFILDLRVRGHGTLHIYINESKKPVIIMNNLPPGLKRFVSVGAGDVVTCLNTPVQAISSLLNIKEMHTSSGYRLRLRLQG